jgi:uncharacterized glyoxalase superfamily protein PhnB
MTDTNQDLSGLSIWPLVTCRDARKVGAYLVDKLGFRQLAVTEKDGIVTRSELQWPEGIGGVILREPHPGYPAQEEFRNAFPSGPSAIYVVAKDVPTLYQRADAAGADFVRPLLNPSEKVTAFAVRDPEGNLWSIADRAFG